MVISGPLSRTMAPPPPATEVIMFWIVFGLLAISTLAWLFETHDFPPPVER